MSSDPSVRQLIERALLRELAARRSLRPHVQLSIPPDAAPATVERAYASLRAHYDPAAYAAYGAVAVDAAEQIGELLRVARELLLEPRSTDQPSALTPLQHDRPDETRRALETLRGAIDRRLLAAEQHRKAGQLAEAVNVLQSVLVLDRANERARRALRELRPLVRRQQGPSRVSRLLRHLLGGPRTVRGEG